ncbi:hypothetical protein [Paenibacillus sp. OAS669]|uniref:hypothetical protein n=1 Tax=Paenibacillus sp. OAS669 TaxID=2663821 RepID=UPI00178B8315|nr:hypothetical protein [Paenibacillus sp. OAS669]MBE1444610.1 multisubunit Na+/H+ antiporter MnhB subunit [Paenibacillus sp. OAS669]
MRWSLFWIVTIAILFILGFEWRQVKTKPKKDRLMFLSLLLIGWLLSMLDLPHTPGPSTFLKFVFSPFKGILEEQ